MKVLINAANRIALFVSSNNDRPIITLAMHINAIITSINRILPTYYANSALTFKANAITIIGLKAITYSCLYYNVSIITVINPVIS